MKRVRILGLVGLLVAGFALQSAVSFAAPTTYTGAVETGDLTAIDRTDRQGVPSTCAAPTTYPGTVELFSPFRYDSHTYTNTGTEPVCLTATLEVTSMAPLHAIVYLGSFNPDDQSENYLADSGNSASAFQSPVSFSFSLGAGQTAVIILQEVATDGVPTKPYTLTIAPPDTVPPVVAVPANITVPATSPAGAVVTFEVSATDEPDGDLIPTCDWTSGSTFPVGTTTVTCTATDAAGNTGTGSFTVTVLGAADALAQLRADTIALVDHSSTERNMLAALDIARYMLNSGNTGMARLMLAQYDLQLTRGVATRRISADDAAQLRAQLEVVRDLIA